MPGTHTTVPADGMRTALAPIIMAVIVTGLAAGLAAQTTPDRGTGSATAALASAQAQEARATRRAERFSIEARRSRDSATKAQADAVALGAQIQLSEARIATLAVRQRLLEDRRIRLEAELANEQRPLVELAGALQSALRRPIALALLRPGSLKETVYLGAVLDTAVPMVEAQTASLRGRLDRIAVLERSAGKAARETRTLSQRLASQRLALEAMAERERITARRASGSARREERRALALAEQARDLDALAERLDRMGALRRRLAALPGPRLRPTDPSTADPAADGASRAGRSSASRSSAQSIPNPPAYRLPVDGRVLEGFTSRNMALRLAAPAGTLVVAPAAGRVAFAGEYRGYGRIVIVEHGGPWTSIVTDLADTTVQVGQTIALGTPIGQAGSAAAIRLEVRRGVEPVNPIDLL